MWNNFDYVPSSSEYGIHISCCANCVTLSTKQLIIAIVYALTETNTSYLAIQNGGESAKRLE